MSNAPKDENGRTSPGEEAPTEDYEVGYKKPPESGRFVKGKSGNPRGRPRKPKPKLPKLSDAPSEGYLEKEAFRKVKLRENGEEIELPMLQAVYRALFTSAAKGSRLAARDGLNRVNQAEAEREKRKLEYYGHLQKLKRDGEETLEACATKGIEPPDLLPHPKDIVLNRFTGEAYVNGPETPEDVKSYEFAAELRNYSLLGAVHNERCRKTKAKEIEEGKICPFMFFAFWLDSLLPRRYRWQDGEEVSLYMRYRDLTKRQRKRLILRETKRLEAIEPPRLHWNPELERATQQFFGTVFRTKVR